jgi:class 3 adenylate cyclase/tetratricopeptide (TPR) repeat protein
VLFADVKGSMELLADRDPEEARKILDPVLERMMEAVHRYEGTVNQVMGDGIMALFGAPLAHEDHAVRACYAALGMQESIKRYAEEVRRRDGALVHVRVGLNSGEVVVRSIGSDLRMDYTAVGQTTHLAARMEQLAMPGSVLIAAATLRLAEGYVEVKPVGPVNVKGLGEPVEAYVVPAAVAARRRFPARARRGLSRFVGRDGEIEILDHALREAAQGRGQVVAVVGEPGVGKSRLLHEFTHSQRMQGWLVLESGSVSYGKATSYLPVIDLLKGYFGLGERDDERAIREKVTGRLLTLDRALEPVLEPVLALLDVAVDDPGWQGLDPPRRRRHTLDGITRLLVRESQAEPLLLVFEDLHWIDSETQALLDRLIESLPAAHILVLVNYRPEYQHAWGSKTYYRQLRLAPLPPESIEELLGTLLGAAVELEPLKRLLVERTEGNPFFLEESVRTLVESGALGGRPGAYGLSIPVNEVHAPATVQAVLSARIDRLPPDEKRLLETAAVLGKDVSFALLQAVADLPEDSLRQMLADLQAGEFLYETSLFPDLEYTFKHALTHEVAYGSVLHERRRALHARIVGAIEAVYPDRLAEHVERLAHHALRGEVWDKAVTYLRQAGAKAWARSANREAVSSLEHALAALAHLPESRANLETGIDLRIDLRNALLPLAEIGRMEEHLAEAERLAEALQDQRRLSRVASYLAWCFHATGHHHRAVEAAGRALAIARDLDDVALEIPANLFLGYAHGALGQLKQAIGLYARNIALLRGDLALERFGLAASAACVSGYQLATTLAELGEFGEAKARAEEALRIARAVEHPLGVAWAAFATGHVYLQKGDLKDAVRHLEGALGLCREWGLLVLLPMVAAKLGSAYVLGGRLAEATPVLEDTVRGLSDFGRVSWQASALVSLGEAHLAGGRLEDAAEMSGRALAFSLERKQPTDRAWALRLLGEVAFRGDPPEVSKAEDHYRQAAALAEELGMRPLVAHCHLGLGKLYGRTGQGDQRHEHLAVAGTMYREMEMRFWLERAEAESRAIG